MFRDNPDEFGRDIIAQLQKNIEMTQESLSNYTRRVVWDVPNTGSTGPKKMPKDYKFQDDPKELPQVLANGRFAELQGLQPYNPHTVHRRLIAPIINRLWNLEKVGMYTTWSEYSLG